MGISGPVSLKGAQIGSGFPTPGERELRQMCHNAAASFPEWLAKSIK